MLEEGSVPFSKYDLIKKKMSEQYEVPDGTFGVEYEYQPIGKADFTLEDIIDALESRWVHTPMLRGAYDDWLQDKRDDALRDFTRKNRSFGDYDTTYGPMSPDNFDEVYSEPQEEDYDSKEDYEKALNEYESNRDTIASEYKYWARREYDSYTDEFLRGIADNNWEDYISVDDVKVDNEVYITRAIETLSRYVTIRRDDKYDINVWTIGMDAGNIEIRSPILKKENMDQVDAVSTFVSTQELTEGTGLHVHIGVPKDFNAFDLLAMTTLVDEGQVEADLKAKRIRRDLGFAKLRDSVSKQFIDKFTSYKGPVGSFKPFIITNSELLSIIGSLDRYLGTNIKAFSKYKTVEFRYFGAHNTDKLSEWINYFLLLPNIAQKRNRVVLHSFNTKSKLYAVRLPGNKVQIEITGIGNKPTIAPPPYPAKDIKTLKEPLPPKERTDLYQDILNKRINNLNQ